MQEVVAHQPVVAHAVHCLPLYDQLELTLELLKQDAWPDFETSERHEQPQAGITICRARVIRQQRPHDRAL